MLKQSNAAVESGPRTVVPESIGDSTITSLSDLINRIPEADLQDHVEEQIRLLERAKVDLEQATELIRELLGGPGDRPDWVCGECGAEVGAVFAVCWQCEAARPADAVDRPA